jgi:hypothetical protein
MSNECEAVGEMGIIMTTFGWEVWYCVYMKYRSNDTFLF